MTGPKAYWSILNRFLGKKKIPVIPPLLVNGIFETVFLTKSNILNKFFANQCSIIDNGSSLPNMIFKTDSRINEIFLSREAILRVVNPILHGLLGPCKSRGGGGGAI